MKSSINLKLLRIVAFVLAGIAGSQVMAEPAVRSIYVNGFPMRAAEIALLDAVNCGAPVPSGRYWVNWQTRAWGYEGGSQRGWLPNCQRPAHAVTSKRFVEDRVFERYGVNMIHMPTYQ